MTEAAKKTYAQMNARERQAYRTAKLRGDPPEAVADEPPDLTTPDIPEAERSDDDAGALTELGRIAAALGNAASDSIEEQRQADRIWNLLNGLTKGAQKRLFENPSVQKLFQIATEKESTGRADDPPGTIYYRTLNGEKIAWSKKPWTWADLYRPPPPRQPMPTKSWVPERRMNVGWNGLMVTLRPRREVTLPEVFYGEYQNGLRQEELAEQHAAYIFGESDKQPEDPGMVTSGTAMARSVSMRGKHKGISQNVYVPGGGFVATEPGNAGNASQLDE
jgi:hypothetical protein